MLLQLLQLLISSQYRLTLNGQRSLRSSLIYRGPGYTRVLSRVQLRGVRNEQRVVIGHAEPRLVLKVDLLAVVEPDDLELEGVVCVGVATERRRGSRGHFVVFWLVRNNRALCGMNIVLSICYLIDTENKTGK